MGRANGGASMGPSPRGRGGSRASIARAGGAVHPSDTHTVVENLHLCNGACVQLTERGLFGAPVYGACAFTFSRVLR